MSTKQRSHHKTDTKHLPRDQAKQVDQAGGKDRKDREEGKQKAPQSPPHLAEQAAVLPAGAKPPGRNATAAPELASSTPIPTSAARGDDGVMSTPTKRS
jgi:hypothetical protein